MDNLLKELILNLGLQTNQLTIIKNADRFFYKSEVKAELSNIGVELVSGSALELRVHFEITFKANPQQIFCYLIDNKEDVLEDMLKVCMYHDFQIAAFFPEYYSETILKCSYNELCLLYRKKPTQTLSEPQTIEYLKKCNTDEKTNKIKIKKDILFYLKSFLDSKDEINWEKSFPGSPVLKTEMIPGTRPPSILATEVAGVLRSFVSTVVMAPTTDILRWVP